VKPDSNARIDTTVENHAGPAQPANRVVVSPHPDDAVLSCWHELSRPEVTRVVTVFAGLPEADATPSVWDTLTRCTDPRQRAADRRAEDRRALAVAGCEPVHLDFVGGSYRSGPLDDDLLRATLASVLGDADIVHIPAGIGGHPDHLSTRNAVLALGRRCVLYADQPYTARFGWPSWVTGRPPRPDLDVDGWVGGQLLSQAGQPEVHWLTGTAKAAKTRAVSEYRSQLAALMASAGADFPHGGQWEYEVFWPVNC
jgi:LmbE family N-acetylglucosaminyl deacetylase